MKRSRNPENQDPADDTEEEKGERLPQIATTTWTISAVGTLGLLSGGVIKIN